jgi:hypothetical protein
VTENVQNKLYLMSLESDNINSSLYSMLYSVSSILIPCGMCMINCYPNAYPRI